MNNFFEQLSNKQTIIHELDTRVKIISVVGFILISSSLQSFLGLAVGAAFLMIVLKLVGTPISPILRRLAWILVFGGALIALFPFITPGKEILAWQLGTLKISATQEGVDKAILLFLRLLSAVLAVTLLNATTGFREVINGFRKLHMPNILVSIIEFTVRYFFVLGDELTRMKLARKARGYDLNQSIINRKALMTITQLIAVLFIRSMERAERVYCAMLARGYGGVGSNGEHRPVKRSERVQMADILWGIGFVCFTLSIKLLEAGGIIG
ncbi:MAG: hypothetical protein APF84_04975 [Gracilibacter sp. BRH_c7a]|nr:MAG: hypothetical protein APF84_04975 [Gracilibacter sp. BRH_c7a]